MEEKTLIKMKLMDKIESIVNHFMTLVAVVGSVYIIVDKIEKIANIIIALGVFIIALIILNAKQMKLNGDKTEQMTKHSQDLEKQLDPKRTSSKLTRRGQTNPLDK